jgi:hypothetical protein
VTDPEGRFTLGALPQGEYILVAWPAEGKPSEKAISIPAQGKSSDYNLEL